jgi:hypothetical protein
LNTSLVQKKNSIGGGEGGSNMCTWCVQNSWKQYGGWISKKEGPQTFKDWAHEIPTPLLSLGITHVAFPCQTPSHKTSPQMNHKNKSSRNKFQNNLKDNNKNKIVTMRRSESIQI